MRRSLLAAPLLAVVVFAACSRASVSDMPAGGVSRTDVSLPYREFHNAWPTARGTKAFAVVRYVRQYSSSTGRMRLKSIGNGGSQSRRFSDSVMPG